METYLTLSKANEKRNFYIYADGKAKETGHETVIGDFAGFYLFLAGEGWRIAKETNIPVQGKETKADLPIICRSRRSQFAVDWQNYMVSNKANL